MSIVMRDEPIANTLYSVPRCPVCYGYAKLFRWWHRAQWAYQVGCASNPPQEFPHVYPKYRCPQPLLPVEPSRHGDEAIRCWTLMAKLSDVSG